MQLQRSVEQEMVHALSFEDESKSTSQLPYMFNSGEEARKIFDCLIHPVKADKFFRYGVFLLNLYAHSHPTLPCVFCKEIFIPFMRGKLQNNNWI
jgi:hypothetical protein